MLRNTFVFMLAIASLVALACGSANDSGSTSNAAAQSGSTANTPPVSAQAPGGDTAVLPSVTSCLSLVRAGSYAEAISPCVEAVKNAPDNAEVAAALAQARSAVSANAAKAQAAAGEAAAGIQAGAEDKATSEAQGLLNKAAGGGSPKDLGN